MASVSKMDLYQEISRLKGQLLDHEKLRAASADGAAHDASISIHVCTQTPSYAYQTYVKNESMVEEVQRWKSTVNKAVEKATKADLDLREEKRSRNKLKNRWEDAAAESISLLPSQSEPQAAGRHRGEFSAEEAGQEAPGAQRDRQESPRGTSEAGAKGGGGGGRPPVLRRCAGKVSNRVPMSTVETRLRLITMLRIIRRREEATKKLGVASRMLDHERTLRLRDVHKVRRLSSLLVHPAFESLASRVSTQRSASEKKAKVGEAQLADAERETRDLQMKLNVKMAEVQGLSRAIDACREIEAIHLQSLHEAETLVTRENDTKAKLKAELHKRDEALVAATRSQQILERE
eukprot:scaffold8554_cov248-Pinguiococcus_pyrenoidosus.AAC.2